MEIKFPGDDKNKLVVKGPGAWEVVAELGGAKLEMTVAPFEIVIPETSTEVFEELSAVHDGLLEAQTDLKALSTGSADHKFLAEMKQEIVCAHWAGLAYRYLLAAHASERPGDEVGKLGLNKDAAFELKGGEWPEPDRVICALIRSFAEKYATRKKSLVSRGSEIQKRVDP